MTRAASSKYEARGHLDLVGERIAQLVRDVDERTVVIAMNVSPASNPTASNQ